MLKVTMCPVETTMNMIGGKWKLLIINLLTSGVKRYGELKKSIPKISGKVLTEQLNELMEDHLVSKKIYAEIPPHTEYKLTAVGVTLLPIIRTMREWGGEFTEKLKSDELDDFARGRISKMGTLCYEDCETCEDRIICMEYREKIFDVKELGN